MTRVSSFTVLQPLLTNTVLTQIPISGPLVSPVTYFDRKVENTVAKGHKGHGT